MLAVLGVADAELLFDAVDAVAAGDAAAALGVVARLSRSGRDAGQFLRDLEMHARELLVVQTLGEVPPELRVTDDRDERLAEQAGRVGRAEVVRLLDLLANGLEAIKNGSEPRTQLELALVKAAAPDVDASTRALLTRIERLEAQLAHGGGDDQAPSVRAVGTPLPDAPASPPAPPLESAAPADRRARGGRGRRRRRPAGGGARSTWRRCARSGPPCSTRSASRTRCSPRCSTAPTRSRWPATS